MKLLCLVVIFVLCCSQPSFVRSKPLSDGENTITTYLKKTLENLRDKMSVGVPDIGLPPLDPLSIPLIAENINEGLAKIKFSIAGLSIKGLRKFDVRNVNVDLQTMTAHVHVFIPEVQASGQYEIDGKIANIVPIYGKGKCEFRIMDFDVSVKVTLDLSTGKLQLGSAEPKLSLSKVNVFLENILGGGGLGDIANYLLNSLGTILFNRHKGDIEKALQGVILNAANKELKNLDLGMLGYDAYTVTDLSSQSNEYFDNLLMAMRPLLEKHDPMALPDVFDGFEKKIGALTLKGYANLTSGSLRGLSSLHRTGDVKATFDNTTSKLEGELNIGLTHVYTHYDAELYFLGLRVRPRISATISEVSVYCKASMITTTSERELIDFRILEIKKPKVSITNMSIFGSFVSFLTNLVISPMLKLLRGTLDTKIREQLSEMIAKMPFPA